MQTASSGARGSTQAALSARQPAEGPEQPPPAVRTKPRGTEPHAHLDAVQGGVIQHGAARLLNLLPEAANEAAAPAGPVAPPVALQQRRGSSGRELSTVQRSRESLAYWPTRHARGRGTHLIPLVRVVQHLVALQVAALHLQRVHCRKEPAGRCNAPVEQPRWTSQAPPMCHDNCRCPTGRPIAQSRQQRGRCTCRAVVAPIRFVDAHACSPERRGGTPPRQAAPLLDTPLPPSALPVGNQLGAIGAAEAHLQRRGGSTRVWPARPRCLCLA